MERPQKFRENDLTRPMGPEMTPKCSNTEKMKKFRIHGGRIGICTENRMNILEDQLTKLSKGSRSILQNKEPCILWDKKF